MEKHHPDNPSIGIIPIDGKDFVRRYSSYGCYPIVYITRDGGKLCAKCVEDNLDQCCDENEKQWYVIGHDANWEDPNLLCSNCDERIESAYAEDKVVRPIVTTHDFIEAIIPLDSVGEVIELHLSQTLGSDENWEAIPAQAEVNTQWEDED